MYQSQPGVISVVTAVEKGGRYAEMDKFLEVDFGCLRKVRNRCNAIGNMVELDAHVVNYREMWRM